tara:strand:- start:134 stop:403 length:270 start_codon:yes stop_codon:yes gene_type:complete
MKKITLSVAALSIAMMSYGQTQCKSLTKDSIRCKNTSKNSELCYLHDPNYVKNSKKSATICIGMTKRNTKCKVKTKHASGLCHHHRKND